MTTVNIGNEQVEIDVLDLEFLSKFEDGVTDIIPEKIGALQQGTESVSTNLREIGRTLTDFFDGLFGEGFSFRVYEGRGNLRNILRDYSSLVKAVMSDFVPATDEVAEMFGGTKQPRTGTAAPSLFG